MIPESQVYQHDRSSADLQAILKALREAQSAIKIGGCDNPASQIEEGGNLITIALIRAISQSMYEWASEKETAFWKTSRFPQDGFYNKASK